MEVHNNIISNNTSQLCTFFGEAECNDAGNKQPNDHNWQNDKADEDDQ